MDLWPESPHRGGAVLAVGAGVGEGVQVNAADAPVFVGAQPDAHLHLVPGGPGDLCFLAGVDQLGRPPGLQRDKGGVDLADGGLLGAEPAADAGLFHPDAAFGDAQRVGQNAPAVENDLGGGDHMQPAVAVHLGVGAEGLHHRLAEGAGVVGAVQHDVAVGQHGLHVAVAVHLAGHQVAAVVAAHRAGRVPVLLRVDQDGVVLGGAEIQHRLQHLVFDLDQLHGAQGCLLGLGGDDGHRVARKPHMPVQDQPVIGGRLRVGLPRDGKPLFGHVLPGVHRHDAGHLQSKRGVDLLHDGVGVGRAQQLDHQRIPAG